MNSDEKLGVALEATFDRLLARANKDGGSASFRDLVQSARLDPSRDFIGASLRNMDFRGEDLRGFNFSSADLRGSDFRSANVTGVPFEEAKLGGVIGLIPSSVLIMERIDSPPLQSALVELAVAFLANLTCITSTVEFHADTLSSSYVQHFISRRMILAIHDLDVAVTSNVVAMRQRVELKMMKCEEMIRAIRVKEGNFFRVLFAVQSAKALPFAMYPSTSRLTKWHILCFDRRDGPLKLSEHGERRLGVVVVPASLAVFRAKVAEWLS
jgi:hypothetical protein